MSERIKGYDPYEYIWEFYDFLALKGIEKIQGIRQLDLVDKSDKRINEISNHIMHVLLPQKGWVNEFHEWQESKEKWELL